MPAHKPAPFRRPSPTLWSHLTRRLIRPIPSLLIILLSSVISSILLALWLVALLQAFRGNNSFELSVIGPLARKSAA